MNVPAENEEQRQKTPTSVFLERQGYRRRRLMDAARLLPLFGALLFAVPLLWPVPEKGSEVVEEVVPMSEAMIYVFAAWSVLIAIVALFGISTRLWTQNDSPHGQEQS